MAGKRVGDRTESSEVYRLTVRPAPKPAVLIRLLRAGQYRYRIVVGSVNAPRHIFIVSPTVDVAYKVLRLVRHLILEDKLKGEMLRHVATAFDPGNSASRQATIAAIGRSAYNGMWNLLTTQMPREIEDEYLKQRPGAR